jgi:hypothetical protein
MILRALTLTFLGTFLTEALAETAAVVAAEAQAAIENRNSPSWWQPKLSEEIQQQVASKGKPSLESWAWRRRHKQK